MLWGIDLGGTKIEGIVLDLSQIAKPLARIRLETEQDRGYEHILGRIVELTNRLQKESGRSRPAAIGIGTPGIPDPQTGLMKNSNTTCLIGKNLRKDLRDRLGCDVVMANDANCFALAEARLGAAKEFQTVFGVIIGTGVGGGVVVQEKVLEGLHGIAGEWGHNPLEENGSPCYCGKSGCVETVISGPALERFYEKHSGRKMPLEEIARRDQVGTDKDAAATIDRLCAGFGKAIAAVINVLDPHAVVLGGGVCNVPRLLADGPAAAGRHVFNKSIGTAFLKPALGDSAGVFGAALLTAPSDWREVASPAGSESARRDLVNDESNGEDADDD